MYSSKLKIVDTANFALWSYGRGASYALVKSAYTCEPDETNSVWLAGDDATAFRDKWSALEDADPDRALDSIMCELWDTYYAY